MDVNLVLVTKSGQQKVFPLTSGLVVIGRRRNCDLRIPIESVSRRHCQIDISNGQVTIRDLGSKNGTYLNGRRIDQALAKAGDRLQVGPVIFVLQVDGQPAQIKPPGRRRPETVTTHDGFEDLDASGSLADLDLEDLDKL